MRTVLSSQPTQIQVVTGFLSVGQFAKCQLNQAGTEGTEKKPESLAAGRRLSGVCTPPSSPLTPALLSLHLREVKPWLPHSLPLPGILAEWLATVAEKRQAEAALK